MKEDEMYILYNYINSEKSIFATMVLKLMDTELCSNDYCKSLDLVLNLFPEIDGNKLEKELENYI